MPPLKLRLPADLESVFLRGRTMLAWRGAIAMGFGLALSVWPRMPIGLLAWLFAVFAFVDGLCSIAAVAPRVSHSYGWLLGLEGLAGVCIGLGVAVQREMPVLHLTQVIGLWGVAVGVCQVSLLLAAIVRRQENLGALVLAMAGGVLLALGLAMIAWPSALAHALARILGSYEIMAGVSTLSLTVHAHR